MTQGFSNNSFDNTGHTTSHASKVNEGAMTQYPYYISSSISTATTHSQYYQLAMEEDSNHDGTNDIVVWFCLKNGKEMNINGESVKVSKISVSGKADILKKYSDGQTITVNQEGKFQLQGNDTFQFSLNDMESYLKETNTTYKKECCIFAKVDSKVTLYGVPANKETWTSVSLKPRQLFDLD